MEVISFPEHPYTIRLYGVFLKTGTSVLHNITTLLLSFNEILIS